MGYTRHLAEAERKVEMQQQQFLTDCQLFIRDACDATSRHYKTTRLQDYKTVKKNRQYQSAPLLDCIDDNTLLRSTMLQCKDNMLQSELIQFHSMYSIQSAAMCVLLLYIRELDVFVLYLRILSLYCIYVMSFVFSLHCLLCCLCIVFSLQGGRVDVTNGGKPSLSFLSFAPLKFL